eukprot:7221009-Prymnesium_polylepis.1
MSVAWGSPSPPPSPSTQGCSSHDDCRTNYFNCAENDMVHCLASNGQCYTGYYDARCTGQSNAARPSWLSSVTHPGAPGGVYCWSGRIDRQCTMRTASGSDGVWPLHASATG